MNKQLALVTGGIGGLGTEICRQLAKSGKRMPGGGVSVTIEGTLTKQGDFEASLVMAKCASKYDPTTHKMKDAVQPGTN